MRGYLISIAYWLFSFFLKYQPRREREWDNHLGEREWNVFSLCIVIAVEVCNTFVQNAEKIVQVACFFLTETSNAENKATIYLIFTDMPARTHTWSSSHFYSRNLRLKYVWFSGYPTDTPYPPLPFKHFKGFPSSAICPSHVPYHSNSVRVLFCWTQLGPEYEINLRRAPYEPVKTLLVLYMTDVISEGSGEHVCLHNLTRVPLTNTV